MMDCDASSSRGSSSGSGSCQLLTRKKRRGIIEKRRRDRINSSLSELRRLVPTAFEKQGSAKLEKAEILQMTVDHLKMLHSKGVDAFTFDPHKFAMDYHGMGFRECASEVARYLVAIEGIDLQDPLRLRLMSHLQCYSAQRELAAKSSWSPASGTSPAPHYPSSLPSPQPAPVAAGESYGTEPPRLPIDANGFRQHFPTRAPHVPLTPPSATASAMLPAPPHAQAPGNQYFHGVAGFSPMTSTSSTTPSYGSDLSPHSGSGVKPYRPWGSEIAY